MDSVDRNRLFDDLDDAEAAVKEALPAVIARHRSAGILTWALLHQIEDEVIEAAAASGECDRGILNILRAAPAYGYPRDDKPVSFQGHEVVPSAFSLIEKAWHLVH